MISRLATVDRSARDMKSVSQSGHGIRRIVENNRRGTTTTMTESRPEPRLEGRRTQSNEGREVGRAVCERVQEGRHYRIERGGRIIPYYMLHVARGRGRDGLQRWEKESVAIVNPQSRRSGADQQRVQGMMAAIHSLAPHSISMEGRWAVACHAMGAGADRQAGRRAGRQAGRQDVEIES